MSDLNTSYLSLFSFEVFKTPLLISLYLLQSKIHIIFKREMLMSNYSTYSFFTNSYSISKLFVKVP